MFLKMVVQLTVILNVDVEEIIEKLMQSDQTSKQLLAILKVVVKFKDNGQNNDKTAISLAID